MGARDPSSEPGLSIAAAADCFSLMLMAKIRFNSPSCASSALFSFPASGGAYSNSGWNAGCGTNGFCGTYSDATSGVQAVDISIQRVGTGLYWNGTAFSSGSEDFQAASFSGGSWSYG